MTIVRTSADTYMWDPFRTPGFSSHLYDRTALLNYLKVLHDAVGAEERHFNMPLIGIIIGLFSKKMDGACKNYHFASFILLVEPPGERYFSGKYIYSELHFDLIEKWSLPWGCGARIFLSALPFSLQTPEASALALLPFSSYQENLLKINFPGVPSF